MSKQKELEKMLSDKLVEEGDIPEWVNFPNPSNYCFNRPVNGMQIDFAWPDLKVGIEVDGGQWSRGKMGHNSGAGLERDARKTNDAQLKGWLLLHFVTDHIEKKMNDYTIPTIREALRQRGADIMDKDQAVKDLFKDSTEI